MPAPAWNVLATALEGRREALLVALRRLGRFRRGGYRNVVVGLVDDPAALLGEVEAGLASDRLLSTALARLLPVETVVRFTADTAVDAFAAAAEPLLPRLGGGSFFVRLERRGMKGRLNTAAVERAVGDRVWRALEALGRAPRVDFGDPDAVLLIETVGDEAGLGVVDRALRARYPFVRIR